MTAFNTQYADAEPQLREALKTFRDTYSEKSHVYQQFDWHYYDIGTGNDHVILWMVGGLRMADAVFRSIPLMQPDFRIIAPSYPPIHTMEDMAHGLSAILKAEGVKQCSVLAGSFGGMIAQVFVREHPKQVNKLILSTTTAPDPTHTERYQQQRDMIAASPADLVMEAAKSQMYGMVNPPESESQFWKAYLNELYSKRLNKEDLLATYDCIIDFMSNYTFDVDDLSEWHGEILILESEDDEIFDETSRQHVNNLYPQAHSHTFKNAGHSPASSQKTIYFEIVRKFLHE